MKRKCKRCKKTFFVPPSQVKAGGGKFCSVKCRDTKVVVKCKNCGKKFRLQKCKIKYKWGCFCSRKCQYQKRFKDSHIKAKCCGCRKKIQICKKEKGKKKFCSKRCRKKYYARRKLKCKNCKKIIWIKPSVLISGGGKFCCPKCYGAYCRRRSRRKLIKNRRPCKQCGKLVKRYPSQFNDGRGKFCSRKCHGKYKTLHQRIYKDCPVCGKEYSFMKCRARKNPKKHCSKKCANEALKNHEMRNCIICNKLFKVIPYRVKTGNPQCCSKFCDNQARKGKKANKQMLWTPELIRALMEPAELCGFPNGCKKPCWKHPKCKLRLSLCKLHIGRAIHALCERRRRRNLILKKEGLL